MDVYTINQNALDILNRGNFYEAQKLFKKNVKTNPSLISFNNLGAFYIAHGMELSNGEVVNANKSGLNLLKKAASLSKSYINLMAIGDWYFDNKDYLNAENYYRQACWVSESSDALANLGSVLFIQKKYNEADTMLKRALLNCDEDKKGSINLTYAFSLIQRNMTGREVQEILESLEEIENQDVIALAYFNGNMKLVEKLFESMSEYWLLDIPTMAIVVDCLLKLNQQHKAEKILDLHIEKLLGYDCVDKKEIASLTKIIKNAHLRNTEISKYRYFPETKKICHFIGCRQHYPLRLKHNWDCTNCI